MTETFISLLSIVLGILGAYSTGYIIKKYSFGIIGNTISGVFGSIFIMKTIGRLGFDPSSIVGNGSFNNLLFSINAMVSFLGGVFGLICIQYLKRKLNT